MVLIYVLWFCGVVFAMATITEITVIIYRLAKKTGKVKLNIICAVIFAVISIGCSSSAVLITVEKIVDSNVSLNDISKEVGEKTADVTANVYKSFRENWNDVLESEENHK